MIHLPIGLRSYREITFLDENWNPGIPPFDADKFPIFARGWECRKPAYSLQTDWLAEGRVQKNWQQIFRRNFRYSQDESDLGKKAKEAFEKLLADIEAALVHGVRYQDRDAWVYMLGGVRYFLGRDLTDADDVSLRFLREPVLLLMRGEEDEINDYVATGEWLCETSLQVTGRGA